MRFLFSSLLIFVLSVPVACAPTSHSQPENHWAQLLQAGRFNLFKRPFWHTRGEVQPTANVASHTHLFSTPDRRFTPHRNAAVPDHPDVQLDDVTSRTTIFPPKGDRSRFEFHVHNPPAGVQISPVIIRCQEIIEAAWVSEVTVKVRVTFTSLGDPNLLARGGGTYFVSMTDKFDTVLPVAAAEAIRGKDINGNEAGDGKYDVLITMNTRTAWYDGVTGSPPPDRYDLITVMLHEIYHNIVFAGSITARVVNDPNAPNGVRQTAELHRNYRTRFDAFLANGDGCAVLSYLSATQLAERLNSTTNQLLAAACTNGDLYFSYNERTKVAKMYAPPVFKQRSSVYHIESRDDNSADSVMFPTVKRGSKQHEISTTIRNIQAATINTNLVGANRKCRHLKNPIMGLSSNYTEPKDPYFDSTPLPVPIGIKDDTRNLVAGLPIWAFVLIILFAILLLLLLLGLCLCLLLRRKRKRTSRSSKSFGYGSRVYSTRASSSSDQSSGTGSGGFGIYRPGHGGRASSSSKKYSSKFSKPFSKQASSSHHQTSRHSTSSSSKSPSKAPTSKTSKHTSSKHTSSKSGTDGRRPAVCPSSGKSRYICGCVICCPGRSVTRPPPVASVHTFDPDSVPSCRVKTCKTTRKTTQKTCTQKPSKKICKTKTTIRTCHEGCHCVYCCRYKPSSHKSAKCSKSVARSSSKTDPKCETVCQTSTKCTTKASSSSKPPSTKPPSTKPSSSRTPPSCKPPATSKRCCKTSCYKCTNVVEINVGYNRC
eukprot:GFKZ01012824.1.p1 GENE.GFKZ01012824.1~~GFKZ01012824.1.p1  ORF type:complete len:765 (-),score=45.60 GFKZ01012824.1:626-2920(-)